ncbi:hypothetical protein AKJ09_02010 [Labilithrix luteola]|uniref:Type IV fimbrial biogenesis protein PilY1 n=1 Tax=Labilithrix luteola TaxID=1391654 RepID=A0A0K1PPP0_9BACT|nr:hypothetical protein [Labilithrix luteola]AKU95346.1 hypothetical protein AKJ09_02010 [Labilithrix luteola]
MKQTSRNLFIFVCATAPASFAAFACGDDGERTIFDPSSSDADTADAVTIPADSDATTDGNNATDASDASSPVCSVDHWCRTPLPIYQNLRAVWGDGTGVVWAVGSCVAHPELAINGYGDVHHDGCILRWDGTAWQFAFVVEAPDPVSWSNFSTIWGSGPTDIWVGGSAGLYHGEGPDSATLTWTRVPLQREWPIGVVSIWGSGKNDVWLAGAGYFAAGWRTGGGIWHFSGPKNDPDGGAVADWEYDPVSTQFDARLTELRIFGSSGNDLWITGSTRASSEIHPLFLHRGVGEESAIAWVDRTPPTAARTPYGIDVATAGAVTAPGQAWMGIRASWGNGARAYPANQSVLGTGDAGTAFTPFWEVGNYFADGAYDVINGFWSASPTNVWMVSDHGRLRHFDGTQWTLTSLSTSSIPVIADLHGVWGRGVAAPNDIWVVGENVAFHHRDPISPSPENDK